MKAMTAALVGFLTLSSATALAHASEATASDTAVSLGPEQTFTAPEDRPLLPSLPVLTGASDADRLDLAALSGQVLVVNVWYEW